MIVRCESCNSKYQVPDDKVAGSMLRTRCKACGAQIVIDGTAQRASNNTESVGTPSRIEAQLDAAPLSGRASKPPPPQRHSKAPSAAPERPVTGTQDAQTHSPSVRPIAAQTGTSSASAGGLDPNAPTGDFYAQLLSKVAQSKSRPPSEAATPALGNGSSGAVHAQNNDFYAKVLAKVQKTDAGGAAEPEASSVPPPLAISANSGDASVATLEPKSAELNAGEIEIHVEVPVAAEGPSVPHDEPSAGLAGVQLPQQAPAAAASASAGSDASLAPVTTNPIDNSTTRATANSVATSVEQPPAATPTRESQLSVGAISLVPQLRKRKGVIVAAIAGAGLLGVVVMATVHAFQPKTSAAASRPSGELVQPPTAAEANAIVREVKTSVPTQAASSEAVAAATPAERGEPKPTSPRGASSKSEPTKTKVAATLALDSTPKVSAKTASNVGSASAAKVAGSAPFSKETAQAMLGIVASRTSTCRQSGGPSGAGKAKITFDSSGQVVSVSVSAPFSGTPAGNCVANLFKRVRVPAFSGDRATVTKSFVVAE